MKDRKNKIEKEMAIAITGVVAVGAESRPDASPGSMGKSMNSRSETGLPKRLHGGLTIPY